MSAEPLAERFAQIKHIVLVLSGKGGVGKSSITTQLALSLVARGKKVGVLDIDLTGPSIPRMLGLDDKKVHQASHGWVPVYADKDQRLACMSIGFLLANKNDSVVWRGPKKNAMIRQFLSDTCWGELDYLIVDTPPGTSDEHISITEYLRQFNPDGAVIVTTPQAVALSDVRKEMSFCNKVGVNILGVVENMSGYICPHCSECTNVFSTGGGEAMADEYKVDFLGRMPVDPSFVLLSEGTLQPVSAVDTADVQVESKSLVERYTKSGLFPIMSEMVTKIIAKVET